MSRARHKRENGGKIKQVWNAGGEQNAAKEAEEKSEGESLKKGGRVHGEGEKSKKRMDRKHGGKAEHKMHHRAKGGRVRGAGIGANLTPLSTAARVKLITKGETPVSGDDKVE